MRIGIDTGGTFTDFVVFAPASDRFETFKVLSTPEDPSRAILNGLTRLEQQGGRAIVHGSTVATNALLERKGVRTALVTTAGFRDVLQIGRQNRPALYDLFADPPEPLVPRQHRLEVSERVNYLGQVQQPLDDEDIQALIAHCQSHDIESVALCLLFSFAHPEHEQRVAAAFEAAGFPVSSSHIILPEFREYERTSATVINAYVSPVMGRYLGKLEQALPEDSLQVMQSNGGMIGPGRAASQAVRCILSGPAGGVVGAQAVAQAAGLERVMTFDMGGTSTDVALIDGEPQVSTASAISGLPIHIAMLTIHTVGSGGGSIAFRDAGGGLQVGPQSAGADPGPASYGKGDLPTVTDANLLLGRIQPDQFFGGQLRLDTGRAQKAFDALAATMDLDPLDCALGVIQIVNAHMARALRVISVEKGQDPRDFSLISFGGAGGLHAVELARELGMPTVIVPQHAATLSALGMLMADAVKDYSRTVMLPGDTAFSELERLLASMAAAGSADLAEEGFATSRMLVEASADLRYAGQSFELNVPLSVDVISDFHLLHQKVYGYSDQAAKVEIVNLRVKAIGRVASPQLAPAPQAAQPLEDVLLNYAEVRYASGLVSTPLYNGEHLAPGHHISGPAIVVRKDTTILIAETDTATIDQYLNLIVTVGRAT